MLELHSITKTYTTAGFTQRALNGVSLSFRENEFVAILGQSGSGKTTLLNIIGGLDRYDSGDLLINGRSTKEYKAKDWDTYRNHSVGFVFQSYNLIPHQSVLRNVELALTLSGVSKVERRKRAVEVLKKVGLEDHMKKRPNQMSGGQMQRVAIARALINDPDILLADEPTGALDSETSVQIMELLKEVARDRLIIMVTHNPDLAEQYATRTVRLKDGNILGDTNPYSPSEAESSHARQSEKKGKRSMSLLTAVSLSLNNLMTKKGRTFMTSFAGSIGIIGIALILSLSNGINTYINQVQQETLTSYPITIQAETVDMGAMMTSLMGEQEEREAERSQREEDRIYSSTVMYDMMNSMMSAETTTNDLKSFKTYLENDSEIASLATVRYGYQLPFDVYTQDQEGLIIKSDVMSMMESAMSTLYGGDFSSYFQTTGSIYQGMNVWEELLPAADGTGIAQQVYNQYDLLYGHWPEKYDEVILFVNRRQELSDLMLYALGYISNDEMTQTLNDLMEGKEVEVEPLSFSFEELCNTDFKLILPAERYQKDAVSGGWTDLSVTESGMDYLYHSSEIGTPLKIVGIARPGEDTKNAMVSGAIGYTAALTSRAIERTGELEIIRAQLEDETTDVLLGLPFATGEEEAPTEAEQAQAVREYLETRSVAEQADAYRSAMAQPEESYVSATVEQQMASLTREQIEEMIVRQYAGEMGVDEATVTSYISEMDDETLFGTVREAMAQQVREQYAAAVSAQLDQMTADQLSQALRLAVLPPEQLPAGVPAQSFTAQQYSWLYDNLLPPTLSESSFEENKKTLGYVDPACPATVSIYADTFSEKDHIADLIEQYNNGVGEEQQITYTDYVALLMSSITSIISGISYLLIAFVSISLVVSSIMIGIITYISVLERTKEIGILRAIGASKRDISRVFNAETLIVGLGAGLIGIGVTLLLLIPINLILHKLTGIENLTAILPPAGGVILVAISVVLTLIAGLIPSRVAAKKDPVEALRSE